MDLDFGLQMAMYIRDTDVNRSMLVGNGLASNPMVDFGPATGPDWRRTMCFYSRNFFMHKISELLIHTARNGGNTDDRQTWFAAVKKIEGKAFKTATSRAQYFSLIKEEVDKLQLEYGFPLISSQFLPSSSTASAAAANNIQLVNMSQNYRPNFGDPAITASQSHPQPGIAHSATSVNIFSDESMRNPIRVPVTSSMGSARSQYEAFNSRQSGPRPLVHDQVSNSNIPLANAEPVVPTNLLHSMNSLMATPLGQPFMPSSAAGSQQQQQQQQQQQRGGGFGMSDPGSQGVLSEQNGGIANSQSVTSRLQIKEWHKSITFNVRNRLIRKMAQILSTTPDPQSGNMETRMHNCIAIATGVENETFRTASSLTHYYDLMAKKCHYIAKERASPSQGGIQYFNLSDIRRTYEALGISYPVTGHSTYPPVSGNNASSPQQPQQPQQQPPPPPPGVMPPGFMGSGGGAGVPYCAFGRGQSVGGPPPPPPPGALPQPPPPGHNQLIDRLLQGAMPLSMDAAEVPEVIKQLAHAYKCQERENQENDVMLLCSLRHCRETKNLLNHITTCQVGVSCCGSTKEIIEHWNRCTVNECPICLPVRQAERSLSSSVATSTSMSNPMSMNPSYMRRPHRIGYPSTATSGLLSNQSPGSVSSGRSERISPRSSMWHSSYSNDSWQRSSGINSSPGIPSDGGPIDGSLPIGRRAQPRFWLHNRNPGGSRHERRPFNNPYPPEIIFVENSRGGQPPRASSLFGPIGSSRLNAGRLQPYGTPWRSPDILFVENVRPAHRQPSSREYSDEPVIIPPDEEATPTEHQQIMAIVKVVKTSGCRLEQKFRCARRSCSASWPCLHRRLAASIKSHKTPIPA